MSLSLPNRPGAPAPSAAMTAEMNVTPMLDVLLVLIIIFMAMIVTRHTMDAQLPAPGATSAEGAVPIVLEVGPGGRYAINRQPVPTTALSARLTRLYAGRPDKRLIVKGARKATYQEVIRAMDVAKGAGVTVIGLETRPEVVDPRAAPR